MSSATMYYTLCQIFRNSFLNNRQPFFVQLETDRPGIEAMLAHALNIATILLLLNCSIQGGVSLRQLSILEC